MKQGRGGNSKRKKVDGPCVEETGVGRDIRRGIETEGVKGNVVGCEGGGKGSRPQKVEREKKLLGQGGRRIMVRSDVLIWP